MLSRRQLLKTGLACAASAVLYPPCPAVQAASQPPAAKLHLPAVYSQRKPDPPPNVLFIGIDDLNDWVGCLGGYPGVKTLHIDGLARRGALFTNAQCASPLCNPSRTALLTGIQPATSGIYLNENYYRTSPALKDAVTIPEHFALHGYHTTRAGKMYCTAPDPYAWQEYWPSQSTQQLPITTPPRFPMNGFHPAEPDFDWGPLDIRTDQMDDWQVVRRISSLLAQDYDRPFFMACGFFHPHQPWYAPREYFDKYPLDQIHLPETLEGDLDDLGPLARRIALTAGEHERVLNNRQWREAIQGYLASISFMDDCVGHVLNALDNSPHRDNTIIVLWSDHGWHLGEKRHWKKRTLWEEVSHSVLIFAGPGVPHAGVRVRAPVSHLDIYPTLIDLCWLTPKRELEGESLRPFLQQPDRAADRAALTTMATEWGRDIHFSIRTQDWRYIQYANGSAELYDHRRDRREWTNLARDPAYAGIIQDLARWAPPTLRPRRHCPRSTRTGKSRCSWTDAPARSTQ